MNRCLSETLHFTASHCFDGWTQLENCDVQFFYAQVRFRKKKIESESYDRWWVVWSLSIKPDPTAHKHILKIKKIIILNINEHPFLFLSLCSKLVVESFSYILSYI